MEQVIRVTRKDKVTPQAGGLPEDIEKAFKLLRHNAQTLDDTYLRDAIDLIEKHLAEWIPVSERLPDDTHETYLIYNEYQGDYYYGVFIGDYDADRKSWWDVTGDKVEVTHWMPLPKPPNKGVKE